MAPLVSHLAATGSICSVVRPERTKVVPCAAQRIAAASPIPDDAPVIQIFRDVPGFLDFGVDGFKMDGFW